MLGPPARCAEVAGDAALYFDPLDTSSIAAALERCLADSELRGRLSAAGAGASSAVHLERSRRGDARDLRARSGGMTELRIGIDASAAAEVPGGPRPLRPRAPARARRGATIRTAYVLYARRRWDETLDERFTWRSASFPTPSGTRTPPRRANRRLRRLPGDEQLRDALVPPNPDRTRRPRPDPVPGRHPREPTGRADRAVDHPPRTAARRGDHLRLALDSPRPPPPRAEGRRQVVRRPARRRPRVRAHAGRGRARRGAQAAWAARGRSCSAPERSSRARTSCACSTPSADCRRACAPSMSSLSSARAAGSSTRSSAARRAAARVLGHVSEDDLAALYQALRASSASRRSTRASACRCSRR